MKLTAKTNTVKTFTLRLDASDKENNPLLQQLVCYPYLIECVIDEAKRSIHFEGDFRNRYDYSWKPDEEQTIYGLLNSASEDYLLRKLADDVFDEERTMTRIRTAFQTGDLRSHMVTNEDSFEKYIGSRHFLTEEELLHSMKCKGFPTDDVPIVRSYPADIRAVVSIFKQIMLPQILNENRQTDDMPGFYVPLQPVRDRIVECNLCGNKVPVEGLGFDRLSRCPGCNASMNVYLSRRLMRKGITKGHPELDTLLDDIKSRQKIEQDIPTKEQILAHLDKISINYVCPISYAEKLRNSLNIDTLEDLYRYDKKKLTRWDRHGIYDKDAHAAMQEELKKLELPPLGD